MILGGALDRLNLSNYPRLDGLDIELGRWVSPGS